jgi:hypothetical protein
MADASFRGNKSVFDTAKLVRQEVYNLGISVERISEVKQSHDDFQVFMLVYEKFYYRSSNRASLSILITGNMNESKVNVVSSGGGQGWLFKFSWGAENNFVNGLRKILVSNGYQEI